MRITRKTFCIILASAFFCLQAQAQEKPLKKISFVPMWKPQAQFAGYYVAREKGIYQKYGLDVTILAGGPDYPPAQLLEDGKADFALMWLASAIERRSAGVKLVNIGQVMQRSALMLIARKSSGILTPRDMEGKKVSLWEGDLQLQPKAFFKKYRLHVNAITQSYTVNLFLLGGVDIVSAMWYNEYHTILDSGINANELTTFFFDQYGLNFPEDGIYAREETFKNDPQSANAFAQASFEGWSYAFTHPDEAIEIVLKYMREANLPANRSHQKWMLSCMQDLIIPRNEPSFIGMLRLEDYARVAGELKEEGLINEVPDFSEFFKGGNAP